MFGRAGGRLGRRAGKRVGRRAGGRVGGRAGGKLISSECADGVERRRVKTSPNLEPPTAATAAKEDESDEEDDASASEHDDGVDIGPFPQVERPQAGSSSGSRRMPFVARDAFIELTQDGVRSVLILAYGRKREFAKRSEARC